MRANINALLEKAEDPEKMLKLIISDMEDALRKATSSTAKAIANARRLKAKYEQATELAKEWQVRAEEALKSGDEELAMKALEKKVEYEGQAQQYLKAYQEAEATVEKLRSQLEQLKAKLEEARTRYSTLIARKKAAEVQKSFAKYAGSFGNEVFSKFDRMEEKILREEEEAEALVDLTRDSVEKEYEEMLRKRKIQQELEALKKKVAGG